MIKIIKTYRNYFIDTGSIIHPNSDCFGGFFNNCKVSFILKLQCYIFHFKHLKIGLFFGTLIWQKKKLLFKKFILKEKY